jgi:hypothetical protein
MIHHPYNFTGRCKSVIGPLRPIRPIRLPGLYPPSPFKVFQGNPSLFQEKKIVYFYEPTPNQPKSTPPRSRARQKEALSPGVSSYRTIIPRHTRVRPLPSSGFRRSDNISSPNVRNHFRPVKDRRRQAFAPAEVSLTLPPRKNAPPN